MLHLEDKPQTFGLADEQGLIDVAGLGSLLGRSQKTVRVDASRRPDTLPPRFVIPGTKKLLWRVADVRAWMEAIATQQAEARRTRSANAAQAGMTADKVNVPKFLMSDRNTAIKASQALAGAK